MISKDKVTLFSISKSYKLDILCFEYLSQSDVIHSPLPNELGNSIFLNNLNEQNNRELSIISPYST